MKTTESINDFYQRMCKNKPTFETLHKNGLGHINIFSRDTCAIITPYSRRDFYKVSLIIGKGKLYYADKWVQIDRPALLFSNPIVPYSWEAESEEQAGWYCLFTEDFLQHSERTMSLQDSPLFTIGSNPVFFPNTAQLEEISSIFLKMIAEIGSDYTHKYDILRSYLHLLIHEAMKSTNASNYNPYANASIRISSLFLELLERQFPIDTPEMQLHLKSPSDFAFALSVHANHLNRAVKEITGKTTTEHISSRIILEAKALLKHSNWNISEVAYALGFEYPSYFTNFFKKHTGVPPKQLKKELV